MIGNLGDPRTATAAACRAGLVTVGTEMAGGGTVSIEALAICRRGVRNVLAHLGVLPPQDAPAAARRRRRCSSCPGTSAFVFATMDGVFEPFHANGAHGARRRARRPHPLHLGSDARRRRRCIYQADGILYGRRQPGRVRPGNCCLVVAAPYRGALA